MARSSSMEGILFQLNSPLGRELEEAFQKAINYVNALNYTNIKERDYVKYRYTETHAYAKRELFPEMRKIIDKHVNLNILKVLDVRNFCGLFAVDLSLDDWKDTSTILARQTGNNPGNMDFTESAKEVSELHKLLDEKTSRLTGKTFGKGKSRPISASLYMDVDMAFLMKDNVPNQAVENLTAAELTGIYLHEIGHLLTMIEQSANAFQTFEQMKEHLKTSFSRKDKSIDGNKLNTIYIQYYKPNLEKLVKEKRLSPKILEIGDTLVNATNYVNRTDRSDIFAGSFEFLSHVLWNLWFGIVMIMVRFYMSFFLYPIMRGCLWLLADKPGEFSKSTDQSTSNSVFYHAERMADEFAVKHGYGAPLASALVKITTASRYMSLTQLTDGKTYAGSLRDSTVFYRYLQFMSVLTEFIRIDARSLSKDLFGPSNYEDDVARLDRLSTDLAKAFKNDLPSEIADKYLTNLKQIKESMKEMKRPWSTRLSDTIWKYLLDFPAIFSRITQTDDMEEMEEYLNRVDKITNNELYAIGAKFRQLAR